MILKFFWFWDEFFCKSLRFLVLTVKACWHFQDILGRPSLSQSVYICRTALATTGLLGKVSWTKSCICLDFVQTILIPLYFLMLGRIKKNPYDRRTYVLKMFGFRSSQIFFWKMSKPKRNFFRLCPSPPFSLENVQTHVEKLLKKMDQGHRPPPFPKFLKIALA